MHLKFLVTLFTFINIATHGQNGIFFYDASNDSIYFNKTVDLLTKTIKHKCSIDTPPQWDNNFYALRSIKFLFDISINSNGTISKVDTYNSVFDYTNTKVEAKKDTIYNHAVFYLQELENCYKKEIWKLAKIEPMIMSGSKRNTGISFEVKLSGL